MGYPKGVNGIGYPPVSLAFRWSFRPQDLCDRRRVAGPPQGDGQVSFVGRPYELTLTALAWVVLEAKA